MTPLKYILETQQELNTNADELMNILSHTAIGIYLNKPLDRGRWIAAYFTKVKPNLTPNGSAWKVIESCLRESTPNRIARSFETFYQFYWGDRPYPAARPLSGKVEKAHARINEYYHLKKAATTAPPPGYMAMAS
ncbi:hypothetical protein L4D09_00570 [Photobacterium makurazakiensis]|uniref:hypothetical protein n=1 Tax=Photobacterium makurazakiensis TaxID=2910234 RepID=UPI003D0FC66E